MKKKFILLVFCLSFCAQAICLYAQKMESNNTSVKGKYQMTATIRGISNEKAVLEECVWEKYNVIDSAMINANGSVVFALPENAPTGFYRIRYAKDRATDFIFNKENISLKTDFYKPIDSMRVITSKENTLLYSYWKEKQISQKKIELLSPMLASYPSNDKLYPKLLKEYETLTSELLKSAQKNVKKYPETYAAKYIQTTLPCAVPETLTGEARLEYLKTHFWDNIPLKDSALVRSSAITAKIMEYIALYKQANTPQTHQEDNFIAAVNAIVKQTRQYPSIHTLTVDYLLFAFERYGYEKVIRHITQKILPELTDESCHEDSQKSKLHARIDSYRKLALGSKAADFEFTDQNGVKSKLSEQTQDYILLVFWASWCEHCATLLPQINKLYTDKLQKKLSIVAVSLDSDKAVWQTFIQKHNLKWTNCVETNSWKSSLAQLYYVYATPTIFLLDNSLRIIARPNALEELKSAIAKIGA